MQMHARFCLVFALNGHLWCTFLDAFGTLVAQASSIRCVVVADSMLWPDRAGDRVVITSRTAVGVRRAIAELRAEVRYPVSSCSKLLLALCLRSICRCFCLVLRLRILNDAPGFHVGPEDLVTSSGRSLQA